MDSFPTEILLNIFTHLSQRYVFTICSKVCKNWHQVIFRISFHSTINIYSKRQLKKTIQLAKERKTINHKPIGYYVKRLIFHYTPHENDIKDLSMFPNLQYIDGLENNYNSAHKYKLIYIHLNQPSNFYYLYDSEQLLEKFNKTKNHLKSLNIYMTNKLINFIPQQQQQQQPLETIYIKSIGSQKRCRVFVSDSNISINMLILPTTSLTNLIKLKIDFICHIEEYKYHRAPYIINEYTFENIHQSCPLLESLSMEDFYMGISDKYRNSNNHDQNNAKIVPAHRLKSLNIMCKFQHRHCFSYLTDKYPHLESLSLYFRLKDISKEEIKPFQNAVLNMLLQFPLLKKLSYRDRDQFDELWPSYQFFKRLNNQSKYYWGCPYSNDNAIEFQEKEKINNIKYNITSLQQQQQLMFLNQLTSLSLDIDDAIDIVFTFLSENRDAITVSSTLQELKILQYTYIGGLNLHIYDWLDIFPNLTSFKISHRGHITDSNNFINDSNNYFYFNECETSKKLDQIIKKKKQQQRQQKQNDILHQKYQDHNAIYKLKYLHILDCGIWFKNGFAGLLKKCPQLKKLELENVNFILPMNPPLNEILLDLSHLHLELLKINNIYCTSFNNVGIRNSITKLIIYEALTDYKRVIEKDDCRNDNQQFILYLKCKFVEGLIYSFSE